MLLATWEDYMQRMFFNFWIISAPNFFQMQVKIAFYMFIIQIYNIMVVYENKSPAFVIIALEVF